MTDIGKGSKASIKEDQGNNPVNRGAYALIVETADQGPILMETVGEFSSYDTNVKRGALFNGAIRWAVVELRHVYGNKLLTRDFERMQIEDDRGV